MEITAKLTLNEMIEIVESISPKQSANIISPFFEDIIIYNDKFYKLNKFIVYEDSTKK